MDGGEVHPAERLEWSHREGAFTLGNIVHHLAAIERWMFAEAAVGAQPLPRPQPLGMRCRLESR